MARGIIGRALYGGAAALESATARMPQSILEAQQREALEETRNTYQTARDVRQEGFAVDRENRVESRATEREIRQDTRADTRQQAGFTHTENLAAAQQTWQAEQNDAQRTLTRDQIAASKSIAATNRQVSLEIAKLGGTVQSDKDGNVLWVGKDGKAQAIMDPNNPDQPLKGYKDLTPAAKAYAGVIQAQLVSLDKKPMPDPGDDARRVQLNNDLLNVLTGGIGKIGSPNPQPTGNRPPLGSFFGGGRPASNAQPGTPQPATEPAPYYTSFVKQRRGGVVIDAPAKSPAAKLNGKTYSSRQEALDAISEVYGPQQLGVDSE